ncbi:MAG: HAD family hydrolase [Phycisphaerales bacterium]
MIFDFDGVIVDSEPLHWRAFIRLLAPAGITFDYPTYLRKYVGFDDRDLLRTLFAERGLPLDDARLRRLCADKSREFLRVVSEGVTAFAGVVALIESAAKEMPVAISSGATRGDIEAIVPRIGDGKLLAKFTTIVTADDVHKSKPDPTCYLEAARRVGVAPADCLAIEDTAAGLTAAAAAGMKTLAVAHTHDMASLNADHVVESLAEVTLEKLRQWYA